MIGCEFANDLLHSHYDVTVIDLAPQPLGRLLPNHVAEAFKTNLEQAGIKFALSTTVEKVTKINDGEDYAVTLANGQTLVADIVLSAIGFTAKYCTGKEANIQTSRGIITNTLLETSQPDIYAVGDCAEVNGTLLPFVMPIMQQARAWQNTERDKYQCPLSCNASCGKTPAAPLTVLPAPLDVDVNWETEEFDDGMIAKAADDQGTLKRFCAFRCNLQVNNV